MNLKDKIIEILMDVIQDIDTIDTTDLNKQADRILKVIEDECGMKIGNDYVTFDNTVGGDATQQEIDEGTY